MATDENWVDWGKGWQKGSRLGGGGGGEVYRVRRVGGDHAAVQAIMERAWASLRLLGGPAVANGTKEHVLKSLQEIIEAPKPYFQYGAAKIARIPVGNKEDAQRKRFLREIESLQSFGTHPHCLKFIDFGPVPDSFITEIHEAGAMDSDKNITRFKGDLIGALRALRGIVDLLAKIHEGSKRAHRDIHPKNIFLDSQDRLILGDFGVAWDEDEILSLTGDVMGTKDMMPHWSRREDLEQAPPSNDAYAFGKTLWMLVAGEKMPMPREDWQIERYNLERLFQGNRHMHLAKEIFSKTIVLDRKDCLSNGRELLELIDRILDRSALTPEKVGRGLKRHCLVCGTGEYQILTSGGGDSGAIHNDLQVLQNVGIGIQNAGEHVRHVARCDYCGHVQLFYWGRGQIPAIWKPAK